MMLADDGPAENATGLQLPFEKRLPNGTQSTDLVAYCDSHDLIALVPSDPHSEVVVYRLNGQAAFTIKRKNGFLPVEAAVTALKWKPDGACLAVGWADGVYGVYSGENGRVLSTGSVRVARGGQGWALEVGLLGVVDDDDDDEEDEGGVVVSGFGWGSHRSDEAALKAKEDLSTEEWYDGMEDDADDALTRTGSKASGQPSLGDLSRVLTTLDVTKVLPRLSAIPSHGLRAGDDGTKFASQAATDGIFEAQKDETSGSVDVLLVCGSDGTVQVLLDESVNIGTCNLNLHPLLLASYPQSPTHAILSRAADGDIQTSFIELPLDTLSGPLLHVIATNTKRLQNLLSYTTHTIRCIHHDLTTGLQFPSRVLKNMNDELNEKQEGDAVTNLYHLAMTGCFTPTMLEWLVDIVKETNHKRWDQAVNGMYANIQNHLFINLLPALDRLSIAATTLRGHARFHEGSSRFDVAPALFTRILDGIDSLRLVAQKVQFVISTEQKQFRAFSKWVRVMIEIGVAGPGSKGATEVEEREVPNLDYPLLLGYMEKTLMQSRMTGFVEPVSDMKGSCTSEDEFWQHAAVKELGYEQTVSALKRLETPTAKDQTADASAATNLPTLAVYLSAGVRAAVESITAWQSRMLAAPSTALVSSEPETRITDLYMLPTSSTEDQQDTHATQLLALSPSSPESLLMHSLTATSTSNLEPLFFSFDGQVLDAKHHPHIPGTHILLVQRHSADTSDVEYALQTFRTSSWDASSMVEPVVHHLHVFAPGTNFTPERLAIGGRKGRTVCLVLGNGGRMWQVLDLRGRV